MALFIAPSRIFSSSFLPSLSSSPKCSIPLQFLPSHIPQHGQPRIQRKPRGESPASVFSSVFSNFEAILENDQTPNSDFKSMTIAAPFRPVNPASVISVKPLTPNGEYVELAIDVCQSAVHQAHTEPGQTLRLGNPNSKRFESIVAIISSPPQNGPVLTFLFSIDSDPCGFASLRPGDSVLTGNVCGKGVDYLSAPSNNSNIYFFVDSPQAFSIVVSLVEWSVFRAMTGTGANRTTKVTVFYSLPKSSGIPYSHRFSEWCLYAVNIVPVQGQSIMEFMAVQSALSKTFYSSHSDFVISAVRLEKSYEALFNALVLLGFRRSAISKFTEDDVSRLENDCSQPRTAYFDRTNDESPGMFDQMSEDVHAEFLRQKLENDIWANWVEIREGMRAEFERKWVAEQGINAKRTDSDQNKRNAWASWSARNEEQWTQVKWDDQAWNDYWRTWQTETDRHSASNSSDQGFSWNQSTSQEYWDWVGHGARANHSPRSQQNRAQKQSRYGSSGDAWGNTNKQRSGYEKGGYRYEYENERNDVNNGKRRQGKSHSQGSSAGWRNWGNWRNQQSSSSSSSSSKAYGSAAMKLDLYAVLGVSSNATRSEIKRAYRRKAMEHHPDRNPDRLDDAHRRIKQIVVAWTVLKDEGSRRKYDSEGVGGF